MSKRPLPLHRSLLQCTVPGCREKRVQRSASNYCQAHRYRWKVHGSPLQDAIRIAHIRRYEIEVRRIFARLPKARRADLNETAKRYCTPFQEFVKAWAEGREGPESRFGREAGERLTRVFESVPPVAMLTRVAAMYLMRQQEPHAFRDERAFRFQLVRTFRKLTSIADGVYWNNRDQRAQQIVKSIAARVQETMGEWLVEFSTPFAHHVNTCATLIRKTEQVQTFLASEVFAPLQRKLNAEHARLERKLSLARTLLHDAADR